MFFLVVVGGADLGKKLRAVSQIVMIKGDAAGLQTFRVSGRQLPQGGADGDAA